MPSTKHTPEQTPATGPDILKSFKFPQAQHSTKPKYTTINSFAFSDTRETFLYGF